MDSKIQSEVVKKVCKMLSRAPHTAVEAEVLLDNVGPKSFKNVSENCLKSVRNSQLHKTVRNLSKICQKCVRNVSASKFCPKCVRPKSEMSQKCIKSKKCVSKSSV